jgi:ribosomal protein S14
MKYRLIKDRRRRILYTFFERRRLTLRAIIENTILPSRLRRQAYRSLISLPRDSSVTRLRNRCVLTGRSRAIVRKFGLSRLQFRSLALQGKLVGVKKAT